jgi:adenylate cyclase
VAGRYAFVHALYQQGLYERLAPARRVRLHRRIGEWADGAWAGRAQERAAELALHFERGHEPERAVHHLEAAAQNALGKHAHREAAALLDRAIGLLRSLPDTTDRARKELALQMALGTPLLMTRGYAAPEVERAFARAHELSRYMDEGPELVFLLAGLFRFFFVRANFEVARKLGDQVLGLVERRDPSLLSVGHTLVGLPTLSVGDFAGARAHLEQSVALYEFDRHRWIAAQHGDDPAVTSLGFLSVALWFLGYPDAALERSREAQALAGRLAVPFSQAFATSFAAWLHVRRGEAAAAEACCDALIALATEQEFPFFVAEGTILRGWARAEQGDVAAGVDQIRQGLATHRATGTEMGRPSHLALLAEVCGWAEQVEDALAALDEAVASAASTGERTYDAEFCRLKAVLLLRSARRTAALEAEAERLLQQAIAIARGQGAMALELRAATTLARLRSTARDRDDSRRILREVYGRFTEGFATRDLAAARTVLDPRGGAPTGR